jgi:hypothetical protein
MNLAVFLYGIIAGMFLLFGTTQCGAPGGEQITANNEPTALHRIVDNEADVACFYIVYSGAVAMDCLPINETALSR